jgi:peptidyl-prolyl cis-trans isomerase C
MTRALPTLLLMLAALAGCRDRPGPELPAESAALVPRVDRPDQVVARVNGVPILRKELLQQMRSGQSRQDALEALIRQELLAQEALRKGLADDPEVRRVRRRAMANLMIRRGFKYNKTDIPAGAVAAAYERNRKHFMHPELVEVAHVLVFARRRDTPEHHRQALKAARQVRAIAGAGKLSAKEFAEIVGLVAPQHPDLKLTAESLTTPQRGLTEESFADAAFELKKPGDVSPVVITPYGYHVIYLKRRIPARNTSLEQADGEIRERLLEELRPRAFEKWVGELVTRHGATIHKDLPPSAFAPSTATD